MKDRKDKLKAKTWERDRRQRMDACYKTLSELLPPHQEGRKRNKVEILVHATKYIRDLHNRTDELFCTRGTAAHKEELSRLKKLVTQLLSHIQLLSTLLKDAGISVPAEPALEKISPKLWSNKITADVTESFTKEQNKKAEKVKQKTPLKSSLKKKSPSSHKFSEKSSIHKTFAENDKSTIENQENCINGIKSKDDDSCKVNSKTTPTLDIQEKNGKKRAAVRRTTKRVKKEKIDKSSVNNGSITSLPPGALVFSGTKLMPVVTPMSQIASNIVVNPHQSTNPIIFNSAQQSQMIVNQHSSANPIILNNTQQNQMIVNQHQPANSIILNNAQQNQMIVVHPLQNQNSVISLQNQTTVRNIQNISKIPRIANEIQRISNVSKFTSVQNLQKGITRDDLANLKSIADNSKIGGHKAILPKSAFTKAITKTTMTYKVPIPAIHKEKPVEKTEVETEERTKAKSLKSSKNHKDKNEKKSEISDKTSLKCSASSDKTSLKRAANPDKTQEPEDKKRKFKENTGKSSQIKITSIVEIPAKCKNIGNIKHVIENIERESEKKPIETDTPVVNKIVDTKDPNLSEKNQKSEKVEPNDTNKQNDTSNKDHEIHEHSENLKKESISIQEGTNNRPEESAKKDQISPLSIQASSINEAVMIPSRTNDDCDINAGFDNLLQPNNTETSSVEEEIATENNKIILNLDTNTTTTMKLEAINSTSEPIKQNEQVTDPPETSKEELKSISYNSSSSFIPISNKPETLHSDLSNDIFASLQVPSNSHNPESISPTAAFLMAFPLVSSLSGKTEVLEEEMKEEFKYQSQTPPMLLQIGAIEPNSFKLKSSLANEIPDNNKINEKSLDGTKLPKNIENVKEELKISTIVDQLETSGSLNDTFPENSRNITPLSVNNSMINESMIIREVSSNDCKSDSTDKSNLSYPTKSHSNYPAKSNSNYSIKSNSNYPTKSNLNYPTKSNLNYPTKTNLNYPTKSNLNYPTKSNLNYTSKSNLNYPDKSQSDLNYPTTLKNDILTNICSQTPAKGETSTKYENQYLKTQDSAAELKKMHNSHYEFQTGVPTSNAVSFNSRELEVAFINSNSKVTFSSSSNQAENTCSTVKMQNVAPQGDKEKVESHGVNLHGQNNQHTEQIQSKASEEIQLNALNSYNIRDSDSFNPILTCPTSKISQLSIPGKNPQRGVQNDSAFVQNNSSALVQNNSSALVQNNSSTLVQSNSSTLVQSNSSALIQNNSSALVQSSSSSLVQNNSSTFVQSNSSTLDRNHSTLDRNHSTLDRNHSTLDRNNSTLDRINLTLDRNNSTLDRNNSSTLVQNKVEINSQNLNSKSVETFSTTSSESQFNTRPIYHPTSEAATFSNSSENHEKLIVQSDHKNEIYPSKKVEKIQQCRTYEVNDSNKITKNSDSNISGSGIRNVNTYQRKPEEPLPSYILPLDKSDRKITSAETSILNDKTPLQNSYSQQQQFIATSNYEERSRTQSTTTVAHNTSNFSILSWTTFSPVSGTNNLAQYDPGTDSTQSKPIGDNFNYLPISKDSFQTLPNANTLSKETFANSVPKESFANTLPKESFVNTLPKETFANTLSKETFANALPKETFANSLPKETFANSLPKETFANSLPKETFANSLPKETFANSLPKETFANALPKETFTNTLPKETFANTLPKETFANTLPKEPFANILSKESFVNTIPKESFVNTLPKEPFVSTLPKESFANNIPKESFANNMPKESFPNNITKESFPNNISKESFPNMPKESFPNIPKESFANIPKEPFSNTIPKESFANTISKESFANTISKESFANTISKESFASTLPIPSSYPSDLQSSGFDKSRTKQSPEMQKRPYLDTSKTRNVRSIPVSQKQSRSNTQTQNHSQNQTLNHSQNQTLNHAQNQTLNHSQNQAQNQTLNHSQNQTLNHSQNQTQNHSQNHPQNQSHTQNQTQSHSQNQTQNHSQNQTQNHSQNQAQNQTQNHSQNQTQNHSQNQTQNHSQNQTQNHSQNQTQNHSQSQTQNHSQNQSQNRSQAEYKFGNDSKIKIKYSGELDYMQSDYAGIDTRQHGSKVPIPPPKQDKANYIIPDYGIQTHFDADSQQTRYNAEIYTNSNFKYAEKSQHHQQKYQSSNQVNIIHDNTNYNKQGQQQQQQSSVKSKSQHQQLQQHNNVRPPVNWMMTPEIKHNSNITDIILPPLAKDLDFCQNNLFSQTPTYNQSTSNQFYNNYDVAHGFPNIPVLQTDPKRSMDSSFYPEEQPFSWSPTKNITQNIDQSQALKSIDQIVPSTLPTLVGDLALGPNLPDKQNFLFGQMPIRGSETKDQPKEKERDFQMLNTQNVQQAGMSFLSVSQLVEQEKAEKNHHQQQPRKQRKSNTSPRNKRQLDLRKQTANDQLRQEEHKSSFSDQNYQHQAKYQQNDIHWRSRNCKSNYTAEALISTNDTTNHDKNAVKYTNYPQNKFPGSLSSTDPMMSINYFPNVDDTSGYGQVVNQNFNHSYGYSSNTNIYPTTNFITSISNTSTNYMMPLHENSDYLETNNFLLPPTTSNITTPTLANINSKNQHIAVSKHQNCDKRLYPTQKKGKRKTDGSVQNFEFPLSGITSPLDDYHHTTHFLPPHANPLYQNHPQANVYPKSMNALAPPPPPLPPAPSSSSLPPPIVSGSQGIPSTSGISSSNHMAVGHHPSGTSLINFNLSTIFPEMNDKNCYKSSANEIQTGLVQSSSHASTSYPQRSSYTNSLVHMSQVPETMQFSDVPRPPLSGVVHYKNP